MAYTGGAAGRNLFFNGLKQVRKSMSCNSLKSVAKMVNEGSHSVSSNRRLLALAAGQDSFLVKSMHTKAMARLEMRSLQKSIAAFSVITETDVEVAAASSSDSDITEGSEDSDEVCSQKPYRKKRR